MTLLEALRLVWIVVTGLGTVVMVFLLVEVWRDDKAISQVRPPRADFLRVHTRGEMWDQAILTSKIFALFLAGLLASLFDSWWPIPFLVLSAVLLVYLGVLKLLRRRKIFATLRLHRQAR